MLNKKDLEKLKGKTEKFFEKMGFQGKIKAEQTKKNVVSLSLDAQEPQILIGKDGQTLMDIQHLLKKILSKDLYQQKTKEEGGEYIFIEFDVNNYRKKKEEHLRELARNVANEVVLTKKEKILDPMSSYERRIIHLELSGREDVKTESIGEEPERKIVIKASEDQ